jgi:hypothetical protein
MKTVYLLLLTTFFIVACDKPVESDIQFTELSFTQTNTPATTTLGQNILSSVRVSGSDLCYGFAYFTVNQQQFLTDIHAIGTYPAKPTYCPQALYHKDTTLSIPANAAGKYILRFYNGSQLFKADTVQVN